MEDYKKKYEDALERAREMCAMPADKATMEYVFPELKDNDERIRKAIIAHMHIVKSVNGVDVSDILAWLEKVKNFDKQLEDAYKNSDEVQYKRGYDDGYLEGIVNAKKELDKQGELTHSQVSKKSDKDSKWNAEDEDVCRLIKDKFVKSVIVSSEENERVLDWFKSIKERLQ